MSDDIKSGDPVHVEYDDTVLYADVNYVQLANGACARREHCTKIVRPVQVGDELTADNIGQLTARSYCEHPRSMPVWLDDDGVWRNVWGFEVVVLQRLLSDGWIVRRIGWGDDQ